MQTVVSWLHIHPQKEGRELWSEATSCIQTMEPIRMWREILAPLQTYSLDRGERLSTVPSMYL